MDNNVKNLIASVVIFGVGAIAGYGICVVRNKAKFDAEVKKAAESLVRTNEKLKEKDACADTARDSDITKDKKDTGSEVVAASGDTSKPWYEDGEEEEVKNAEQYTIDPRRDPKDILEDQSDEDDDSGLDAYEWAMGTYNGSEDVVLITKEEWCSNDLGYEIRNYIFFENEESGETHMIDEDGKDVDGWEYEVGFNDGNLDEEMFDKYDGTVYVRNDQICVAFSIRKSTCEYIK